MKWWVLVIVGSAILVAQVVRRDAAKLFQDRRYAESAALLESQLRKEPRNLAVWMLLGLCRLQTGDAARAEESFLTAIRLQPTSASAYYSLARSRFLLGRFDDAGAAAEEARRLGEPTARVYELLARIEEERGNYYEALSAYRRALESDRSLSTGLAGEASVLYKLGRYEEARSSAQAALRIDPLNVEAKRVLDLASRDRAAPPGVPAQAIRFTLRHTIQFQLDHFPTDKKHLISTMAGGLAAFDFDNDRWIDLFFANGAELPSFRKSGPRFWNRLYRNLGDWRFEDVTERQGLAGVGFAMGAAAADFDNDGRIDLFVPGIPRSLLYRNTPNGFVDVSRTAGIRGGGWSIAGAWLDYDRDGFLDLFVVNYLDWSPSIDRFCGDQARSIRVYCHPREYPGLPNQLYRNRGDGTFEDVSERAGIAKYLGKGMSAAVIDADSDGWPDVFVTNDTLPNFLFRNRHDGAFEEAAVRFGVALNEQGKAVSSMGVDARDYDNDGLPDLIVTALVGENFQLFRNMTRSAFEDRTFPSRLGIAAVRHSGWGVALGDLNNDGWKDLFTANSHVTDNVELIRSERYLEPNSLFLNRQGIFHGVQEIGSPAAHRGLVLADIDNDGRLDAVVTVLGSTPELWRNETDGGNWIKMRLEGQSVGARVRIGSQWQERSSASGYASSNLDSLHFGLGSATVAPEIEVLWPSGTRQSLKEVKAGQTLVVREPARP